MKSREIEKMRGEVERGPSSRKNRPSRSGVIMCEFSFLSVKIDLVMGTKVVGIASVCVCVFERFNFFVKCY